MSEWQTVSRKKAPVAKNRNAQSQSSAAYPNQRDGTLGSGHYSASGTSKFPYGGDNKQRPNIRNPQELDEATDVDKIKRVNIDIAKTIMKARQAAGLSQKDLAQRLNEKPQLIAEYESGRAIFNGAMLSKMEGILKVRLCKGSKLGEPIVKDQQKVQKPVKAEVESKKQRKKN